MKINRFFIGTSIILVIMLSACSIVVDTFTGTPQPGERISDTNIFPLFTDTYTVNPAEIYLVPFVDYINNPERLNLTCIVSAIYSEAFNDITNDGHEGFKSYAVSNINTNLPVSARWHGIGYEYKNDGFAATTNMDPWVNGNLHFRLKTTLSYVFVGMRDGKLEGTGEYWIDVKNIPDVTYNNDGNWYKITVGLTNFSETIGINNIGMFFMLKATNAATNTVFEYDGVYWSKNTN